MRILVDGRHLTQSRPSGVGEYTTRLLGALFRLDTENEYTVLTTGRVQGNHGGLPLRENVTFRHVSVPNRLLSASQALTGRPYLDELAGGHFDRAFLPNICLGSVSPTLPYTLTVHDLSWKLFPELYSTKMRLWHRAARAEQLIRGAASILTPSTHTRRDVLRTFSGAPERVHAIPHGLTEGFSPKREASDDGVRSRLHLPKRFALFLGTLEPRKNIHAVLDAVETYRRETGDDVKLVLAGGPGWNNRSLERRLRTPQTRAFVRHIGYIPATDRPALYRSATVFLWPSLYEGFGLPVLEAMACGLPVITSAVSALPEVTGGAAVLVNPYDAGEMAAALRETITSPAFAASLRADGLKQAARFSWEKTAQEVLTILTR